MAATNVPHHTLDSDRSLRGSTHLFGLASNPIRLRILICVVDGAKTIDQICKQLGRDRRLVNQYVQTLAQANLLRSQCEGRVQVFTPTQSGVKLIQAAKALTGPTELRSLERENPESLPSEAQGRFRRAREEPLTRFVDVLKAFADPVRLRLLNLLTGEHEVCVCHLHEARWTYRRRQSRDT